MPDRALQTLILNHPLCLECIADNMGTTTVAADEKLRRLAKSLQIEVVPRSRCANCGETRVTFCIRARAGT